MACRMSTNNTFAIQTYGIITVVIVDILRSGVSFSETLVSVSAPDWGGSQQRERVKMQIIL